MTPGQVCVVSCVYMGCKLVGKSGNRFMFFNEIHLRKDVEIEPGVRCKSAQSVSNTACGRLWEQEKKANGGYDCVSG